MDVQCVQELLKSCLGRWGLALELCELWQWRTAKGGFKRRAALAILVEMGLRGPAGTPFGACRQQPTFSGVALGLNATRGVGDFE